MKEAPFRFSHMRFNILLSGCGLNFCDEKRTSENFKCLHVFLSFALNWGTNNTSLLNKQKSSLQKVVLIGGKKKFLNQYISLAPVVALFTV